MNISTELVEIMIPAISSLLLIGYKFGIIEKQIEKHYYTMKDEVTKLIKILEDELDMLGKEITILKSQREQEEKISSLKTSRIEYTLGQDIKLLKNQVNQINKYLEKQGFQSRYIDKSTLQ
jgi:hypothetical protein